MCLLANPAAVHAPSKAVVESGARACTITRIDVRCNGGYPSCQAGALRVGEDLAVTSGSVVYRDALCEVIQSVVAY